MRGWLRVGNERMVKGAEKGGGLRVGDEEWIRVRVKGGK